MVRRRSQPPDGSPRGLSTAGRPRALARGSHAGEVVKTYSALQPGFLARPPWLVSRPGPDGPAPGRFARPFRGFAWWGGAAARPGLVPPGAQSSPPHAQRGPAQGSRRPPRPRPPLPRGCCPAQPRPPWPHPVASGRSDDGLVAAVEAPDGEPYGGSGTSAGLISTLGLPSTPTAMSPSTVIRRSLRG